MKTEFTIEEIRNYLLKEDSFGDALYHLKAENIIKANEPKKSDCCDAPIVDGSCEECGELIPEKEEN